ncbi:MAG: hypothetical protein AAGA68_07590 [Pseudomonadota bacterium]
MEKVREWMLCIALEVLDGSGASHQRLAVSVHSPPTVEAGFLRRIASTDLAAQYDHPSWRLPKRRDLVAEGLALLACSAQAYGARLPLAERAAGLFGRRSGEA